MRKYGLIGSKLSHSFSKKYFAEKFQALHLTDCLYSNYELQSISGFPELIQKEPGLLGLNVTIPYKQSVVAFMNDTDAVVKATGVVNTIKINRPDSGIRLLGFNTDAYGFENSISPLLKKHHRKALILGTGASSRTVSYVFKNAGIECLFASRSPSTEAYSYAQLNARIMSDCLIVVNTTPVGTFPETESSPGIPYEHLTPEHLLFDLVYNPPLSLFLQKGKARGAMVQNGCSMLKLQADRSWEIWNDSNLI